MPTYQTEFPDFDPATMPAVPADWTDVSWGNDTCPCFEAPNGLFIFIDYEAREYREFREGERFTVTQIGSDVLNSTVCNTDDFEEAKRAVGGFQKG